MLKAPQAGSGFGACPLSCFVENHVQEPGRQSSQQGTGEGLWVTRPARGGTEETGIFRGGNWPQVDWPGWVVFPWQRPWPGSQKAKNSGATDSVGLASQGC